MWSQALTREVLIHIDIPRDVYSFGFCTSASSICNISERPQKQKQRGSEPPPNIPNLCCQPNNNLISAPQAGKSAGKTTKNDERVESEDFIIIGAAQALTTQHGSAQLSLFLWWFIKNNWPNDRAPHCTTISSAVVVVIGKKLGREEKVRFPNRKGVWLQTQLPNIKI